jgi:iron(III) transport system permease protein
MNKIYVNIWRLIVEFIKPKLIRLAVLRSLFNGWSISAMIIAILAAIPIFSIIALALTPDENIWGHLTSTVLPRYIATTLGLMIGVGIGTTIIGVSTAWILTTCKFPCSKIFEWALLLPLAIPAYVIAFVYTDILEYAGPIQAMLREIFGWNNPRDYWFPEVRSLGGAIIVMTLVLYPYVYMLARTAFLEQSFGILEVSKTLGCGPWRTFFWVALPMARPGIIVGLSLVMMETLNDFGTVDFFAVGTLTLGVFDVWMNMNNAAGAAQIAVMMLFFVAFLIGIERFSRRKQRFYQTTSGRKLMPRQVLTGWSFVCVLVVCWTPLMLGFLIPIVLLINGAVGHFGEISINVFIANAVNSLTLSSIAAIVALVVGVILVYGLRLKGGAFLYFITRFASLGYAVPGAVLAIGIIIPLAWLDNSIDEITRSVFGVSTGLILSGTTFALILGCVIRFLALSIGAIEQSLGRITRSIDDAARTLGASSSYILWKVHLPIIRGSLITASILVFVDAMKELPMTVIMRPFNFETLATQVYQFAAAEEFGQAAIPALAIVATGVVPVILLSIAITYTRNYSEESQG